MIDLRSDTVTRPTAEMRRMMANAHVGDAVIDTDPTVEQLEQETARVLGKPAALFMPSGTMSNQIALRVHCERGTEFLCEADCHIYHYEQGAYAQLSGLASRIVTGNEGVLWKRHLDGTIRPNDDHAPRTRLLCLENTHNRWGGRVMPEESLREACQWARDNELRTHLDGARLWNAAVTTGSPPDQIAAGFDSISVCFSKGLGAPVGSALVGDTEFISEARRARKLFGGGMRQAGIIAAGALHALQNHQQRLHLDHEAAQELADAARKCSPLSVRGDRVDTNIVVLEVDPDWGTAIELQAKLASNGIECFAISTSAIRLVTHLDVSLHQIEAACRILRDITQASELTH